MMSRTRIGQISFAAVSICMLLLACSSDDNPVQPPSTIVRVPGDHATIQAAIDAIDSATTGWTVLVADGEYTGEGNRDISFKGKQITVRSVNGAGSTIINCEADSANPHRAFIFDGGEDSTFRLEGFTIKNGYADLGGAIYCAAAPLIQSCVFSDNMASQTGGAIYMIGSWADVESCSFVANQADIRFSSSAGGAVYCASSIVAFKNCEFNGNSATQGGALVSVMATVTLDNCDFADNSASSIGGAITGSDFDLDMSDCNFAGNTASKGGGALFYGCRVTASSTGFVNNSASINGGAISSDRDQVLDISFCHFDGNNSPRGGAIDLTGTDPSISKSTFTGNEATHGSALFCLSSSKPTLEYCIIAFGNGIPVVANDLTRPEVVCCDVYGNIGGDYAGSLIGQETLNGNFSLDPLFCDPDEHNFRLEFESPCTEANSGCGIHVGAFDAGCVQIADDE
ncbi:MAG: hypothetical protein KKH67_01935 [candidate division Zixibacteria bacterium]|nr:hypothetical protein [candidate division Zixibacteria bacterium]